MEPPPRPSLPSGSSASLSGFQSASSLPRSSHAPSLSSNRNASGNLPPTPKQAVPPPTEVDKGANVLGTVASASSKPVNRPAASKNAIVYSVLQRRNPILPLIRNVGLEIGDIVVDYQVGAHNGVLFLSLKYHRLHPEYIHTRIEKMRNAYNLRILLVLCDINEHQQPLRELSKVAVINEMTILVAFSSEEAAQYLTTLKAYEHKSADTLKEKVHQTYPSQLEHVLTSGRKVNKSNAEAIAAQFGSFHNIVRQSNHSLSAVKGLGKVKIVSLLDAFNKPFVAGQGATSQTRMAVTTLTQNAESEAVVTTKAPVDNGIQPAQSPDFRPLTPPTPTRPRDQGPSRSPSLEPDDSTRQQSDSVWHDPLDDDDDDDDETEDVRISKRQRV
ncbi:hypothetical protein CC85DRAFT_297906 [Cutaneotrichosporon oleaginosum]|uniref:ERCC1-like central domain-containing protein n=1 Tax=Cutaneotrichosporon oleaginosum TaxID=879819 RepID=A0A0J0XEQ5_9TREE|nr:uncharacterized protein CC85DRAFT_297906 [Cutaneotrichosporon oleaginosum]KLT39550.1 hypothetical protein CC85DRAFT_297906 [Cutaneotrichosporon oleaginosum]TXT08010.1 hypothetical protein COLE_04934 [Cutaneotrichosporon oleaginosum]